MAQDGAAGTSEGRATARWEAGLIALYALMAVLVTWQEVHLGHVNNFAMFRWSFFHLREGISLYAFYPSLYFDRFQYGPTFAFLIAPFALPPAWLGLLFFNVLNIGVFYFAIRTLLPGRTGLVALVILVFEVLRTTQNSETNALVAGLMILAFVWMERERMGRAAWAVAIGAAIKIFPLAAAALALPSRRRWRFGLLLAGAFAALLLAPLLLTPPSTLAHQYHWWGDLERSYGPLRMESVMGLIGVWMPGAWPNWPVQVAGTLVLLLPFLVRRRDWGDPTFRRAMLCSVLGYVVLFNHQAESPTFVVAMAGVVAWYLTASRRWYHHAVMVLAWLLVSLSSEVLTRPVRAAYLQPWHYKTVPVALAWLVMQWELLRPTRTEAGAPALSAAGRTGPARPA